MMFPLTFGNRESAINTRTKESTVLLSRTVLILLTTLFTLTPPYSLPAKESSPSGESDKTESASAPSLTQEEKDAPIHITSDKMKSFGEKNMVTFLSDVIAIKGDLTIRSDRLDVYSDKERKKPKKMIATGNVIITRKLTRATCKKAIYEEDEKKITLLGFPVVTKEENEIKGSKIVYFLQDENVIADGDSNQRVNVTLYPDDLQKEKEQEEAKEKEKKSKEEAKLSPTSEKAKENNEK